MPGAINHLCDSREPEAVSEMFGAIAPRYDLANHILSCGCDFYWRNRAAEIVAGWEPKQIIDLATGTGDLALLLQRKVTGVNLTGADFSNKMLAIAKEKGLAQTVFADILRLPFPNDSFDCITIAFGLRNVQDWPAALGEMLRVLQRGGHLLILEFSLPQSSVLRAMYRFYLHHCLPLIGSALTKKKNAYDYLGESIERFPNGEDMVGLIKRSGFAHACVQPLTGGIVSIYTAEKT